MKQRETFNWSIRLTKSNIMETWLDSFVPLISMTNCENVHGYPFIKENCLFVLFLFCQIKILQIWMPLGTIRKPLMSRGASRWFHNIYTSVGQVCSFKHTYLVLILSFFESVHMSLIWVSRFIFIYQVGINNCQIALRIMGMNLGSFKSAIKSSNHNFNLGDFTLTLPNT